MPTPKTDKFILFFYLVHPIDSNFHKCDRIFPCSSCIRRGTGNLCPDGTLEKGKRGFLKRLEQALPQSGAVESSGSTEVAAFVSRDTAMLKRIQELESELVKHGIEVPGGQSRSKSHKRRRPSGNLDDDKPSSNNGESGSSSIVDSETSDIAVGFGTLTIDPKNRARYIGLGGGLAYLDHNTWGSGTTGCIQANNIDKAYEDQLEHNIEAQVIESLSLFPTYEEAVRLGNLYFRIPISWYEIISKNAFFLEYLPALYSDSVRSLTSPLLQHTVALVGAVLALGQWFDLDKPRAAIANRANELLRLAVSALNGQSLLDGGLKINTSVGIQALHVMAMYNLFAKGEEGSEATWQMVGLAVRSAQSQGLHVDGSRWCLSPECLESRRRIFWEVYTFDRLNAFTFGRPHAQSDAHFDCQMPTTSELIPPSDSEDSWSAARYHILKFKWMRILGRVTDDIFSVKRPTYASILACDREINDFYFSLPKWAISPYTVYVDPLLWEKLFPVGEQYDPYKEGASKGIGKPEDMQMHLQIHSLGAMIFMASVHLHRGPFCLALMMEPKKLLKSQYERSIVKLVSSATAVINTTRGLCVLYPALTSRLWYLVFHAFSAAVCQAVLVIVAPFHPLALHAFLSLRDADAFFKQADGPDSKIASARLSSLVNKAARSMEAFRDASAQQWQKNGSREIKGLPRSTDMVGEQRETEHDAGRVVYPESNVRNTEELLGTSTKLVRVREALIPPSNPDSPPSLQAVTASQQPLPYKDPLAQMMGLYNTSSNPSADETPILQANSMVHDTPGLSAASWIACGATMDYPATEQVNNPSVSSDTTQTFEDGDVSQQVQDFNWEALIGLSSTLSPPSGAHSTEKSPSLEAMFPETPDISHTGQPQAQAPNAGTSGYGYLNPGLHCHFDEVNRLDLSSFIQDGVQSWANFQ